MLVSLAALWRSGSEGDLAGLASQAASHGTEQGAVALLKDVLGY